MKYSIKFTLDKKLHQIYLFFNYEGVRFKYYTGYRIEPTKWNKTTQRVDINQVNNAGQTSNVINKELDKIKDAITEIYETHYFLKHKISLPELKNELKIKLGKESEVKPNTFFDYFEDFVNSKDNGTKKQMNVTFNHFKRFCDNKIMHFEDITPEILTDFEKWLQTDKVPKGKNTIRNNFKRLRTFFNYAVKKEWIKSDADPFKKFTLPKDKYGDPIYITKKERDLLYNADLSSKKTLDKVRDIFIFQCLIGARVGDLVRLTNDNIINESIVYIQNKTKNEDSIPVSIPLTNKAKAILSKYNQPDGQLLPFITGQKYNVYLKDLFEFVGITRKVVRLNPNTGNEEIVRICDIASSHMARRTFIGVMYENGIKNDVIGSMSGHIKGSKAFGRYYSVSEKLKQDAINGLD
jgi:integrase